jgi:chaperonin cofactor prefoldin
MKLEDIKKKKEELIKQHNTLKDKIDEGRTAIANMQAQLNGLVGAIQLCDDFLNNPVEPEKDK